MEPVQYAPGKWSYGRSLSVDPWGTVLATAPDAETVVTADLDLDRLVQVRRQVPSLANRQPAAYQWPDEQRAVALAGGRVVAG